MSRKAVKVNRASLRHYFIVVCILLGVESVNAVEVPTTTPLPLTVQNNPQGSPSTSTNSTDQRGATTAPRQAVQNEKVDDNDKDHWWIRYVVVPIMVALIALLGVFLTRKDKGKTPAGKIDQRGAEVKQSTKEGHNVNNVIGNVTINNPVKDKDSP